jgi:TPR repeat protein
LEYFKKSETSNSYFNIGNLYLKGSKEFGIEKNDRIALKNYLESRLPYSYYNVGNFYFNGSEQFGIKRDYELAMKYLLKSKTKESYFLLGEMYRLGLGVKIDLPKSEHYYYMSQ